MHGKGGTLDAITSTLSRVPRETESGMSVKVAVLLHTKAWLSRGDDRAAALSDMRKHGEVLEKLDPILACLCKLDAVVLGPETKDLETFEPVYSVMDTLLSMKAPLARYVIARFWSKLARRSLDTAYLEVSLTWSDVPFPGLHARWQ